MKETLGDINERFNKAYVKACHTSQPEDWGAAALVGRQVVERLGKMDMIEDNFMEIYEKFNHAKT